uniref:non-specific serine/threonine protein kinase n=1 Tax=Fagus sylvatica TaxID=28930 RepID=A0A2N9F2K4_FAGSY
MAALSDKRLLLCSLVLVLVSLLHFATFASSATSSVAAAEALLKWKASLDNQSQPLLSSWVGDRPCNNWVGIACEELELGVSVTSLNLSSFGLIGTLYNLNFSSFPNLLTIDLFNNSLYGTIPDSIGMLGNLSRLILQVNEFSGPLPPEIGKLGNLRQLFLTRNTLSGNLSELEQLYLYSNNISGPIPEELGLLQHVFILQLLGNSLSGPIPASIGKMSALANLRLEQNQLSGPIPTTIGNLSKLDTLYLSLNKLSGPIPAFIGKMAALANLRLQQNQLSGPIPTTIGNLSKLDTLDLAQNKLSGKMAALANLRLQQNQLSGPIPTTIGNLSKLDTLYLAQNKLSGSIPASIGNLTKLTDLVLITNNLSGPLPLEMNNLTRFDKFATSGNNFTGQLPQQICLTRSLEAFTAINNHFTGPIPTSLKNCTSLKRVRLEGNQLTGNISEAFGIHPSLNYIDLSDNNLYGEVSSKWGQCHNLTSLKISNNNISGKIPPELGEAAQLGVLDPLFKSSYGDDSKGTGTPEVIAPTSFEGSIPSDIGSLQSLQALDLSKNLLIGEIPPQLGSMKQLETLNLSHNNLSGSIPSTFDQSASLTYIDISYNELEGRIPNIKAFHEAPITALQNNKGLCGNATGLEACPKMIPNLPSKRNNQVRKTEAKSREAQNDNLFAIWSYDGKMVYENIIDATEEFDSKYCIGVGGYGSVYKVELPTSQVVAVKKLHSLPDGEICNQKAFTSEIRALTEIRHLRKEQKTLDWIKRANVIKGVANALSYMHHDCSPPIIHRDISSKNILLDQEYEAHIADFGTARLLKPDSSNWTSLAGTFGYMAPAFTTLNMPLKDVLDQRLSLPMNEAAREVLSIAKIAIACLHTVPQSRPTMQQVSQELSTQKLHLPSTLHMITLGEVVDL